MSARIVPVLPVDGLIHRTSRERVGRGARYGPAPQGVLQGVGDCDATACSVEPNRLCLNVIDRFRLLCQWAAHLGARVIGATSGEAKARAARAAGAHDVVLLGEASLEEQVMDLTRGRGADVIYDGVGRDSFAHSVAALAIHGHLVSYGQASGDIGSLAAKSAKVSRPNFAHFTDTPEMVAAITGRLFDALERRVCAPRSARATRSGKPPPPTARSKPARRSAPPSSSGNQQSPAPTPDDPAA